MYKLRASFVVEFCSTSQFSSCTSGVEFTLADGCNEVLVLIGGEFCWMCLVVARVSWISRSWVISVMFDNSDSLISSASQTSVVNSSSSRISTTIWVSNLEIMSCFRRSWSRRSLRVATSYPGGSVGLLRWCSVISSVFARSFLRCVRYPL